MKKAGDDTGGKFERFIFTAPAKLVKSLREEAKVDMTNVIPAAEVYKYIDAFFKQDREREFTLSPEANNKLDTV